MAEDKFSTLAAFNILKVVDEDAHPNRSFFGAPRSAAAPSHSITFADQHTPVSDNAASFVSGAPQTEPHLRPGKPLHVTDPTDPNGPIRLLPPVNFSPFPIDKGHLVGSPGHPQARYGPLVRAFALALRPFVTLDGDLSASGKAFFVGSPLQYGIPTSLDEKEYLNEALFTMSDPIQTLRSPVFSTAAMSYFEWLRAYVRNVEPVKIDSPPADPNLAAAYKEAAQNADIEFKKALHNFKDAAAVDTSLKFNDWMNGPFGKAYRDACDDRDAKNEALRNAQGKGLSDVARAREMLDSARGRLDFKVGNNMPCALRDISDREDPKEKAATFLPLYYLSGYAKASETWITRARSLQEQNVPFKPVPDGPGTTWAHLGFPDVEDEMPKDPEPWLNDITITLRFRGMGAFDVRRGLWDISGLKTVLPPLLPTAVHDLKRPILKTTKVLIGYGVQIIVELPPKAAEEARAKSQGGKLAIVPEILGNMPATWNDDGTSLVASLDAGNAYPVLLGVLCQSINDDEE